MKNKTKKQNTVFLVTTSWDNDNDDVESPNVELFSTLEAARKYMERAKAADRKNGITRDLDDPDEEWEVTDKEDYFHAWNELVNKWIEICVCERVVR